MLFDVIALVIALRFSLLLHKAEYGSREVNESLLCRSFQPLVSQSLRVKQWQQNLLNAHNFAVISYVHAHVLHEFDMVRMAVL